MQHRQLGSLSSFKSEATVPLPSSASSDDRLKEFSDANNWRPLSDKSIACGSSTKWWFALLNLMWFTLLVFHIRYSMAATGRTGNDNSSSMSGLGQRSGAWLRRSSTCAKLNVRDEQWAGDLREFEGAWNRLCFGPIRDRRMRIGAFVKKWPLDGKPAGMEHHASTLYHDLARRGHDVHVFTTIPNGENITDHVESNLHIHIVHTPVESEVGTYSPEEHYWQKFLAVNSSSPFDVVHTENAALAPRKAIAINSTAATWHEIAAECVPSDIAKELNRNPEEPRSEEQQRNLFGRLNKIVEETKAFTSYGHHVAISDYVADVMRTIYEFPVERVHTIFDGVDGAFQPNPAKGTAFRFKHGVPAGALVFGVAGRSVKEEGHPLLFEAFSQILQRHSNVYLLVAGSGPWLSLYSKLAPGKPNVVAVGTLAPEELSGFYNALDVFLNPTLRSQGLDLTLMEALLCGKALMATHFGSITWSVIISKEFGSTFAPNVGAITVALEGAIRDGSEKLALGAQTRVEYARMMFMQEKMGAAYERLFLCLRDEAYCAYPLPTDQCEAALEITSPSFGRVL